MISINHEDDHGDRRAARADRNALRQPSDVAPTSNPQPISAGRRNHFSQFVAAGTTTVPPQHKLGPIVVISPGGPVAEIPTAPAIVEATRTHEPARPAGSQNASTPSIGVIGLSSIISSDRVRGNDFQPWSALGPPQAYAVVVIRPPWFGVVLLAFKLNVWVQINHRRRQLPAEPPSIP
jgi:hypothetical protein